MNDYQKLTSDRQKILFEKFLKNIHISILRHINLHATSVMCLKIPEYLRECMFEGSWIDVKIKSEYKEQLKKAYPNCLIFFNTSAELTRPDSLKISWY